MNFNTEITRMISTPGVKSCRPWPGMIQKMETVYASLRCFKGWN
jgi:hypothetical protein